MEVMRSSSNIMHDDVIVALAESHLEVLEKQRREATDQERQEYLDKKIQGMKKLIATWSDQPETKPLSPALVADLEQLVCESEP